MTGPLVVGVDVGSQSVKAGLFDLHGTPLAEASQSIPLNRRGGDEVDQDPDELYGAATATIAACTTSARRDPKDVVAIAACGQMAGVLGIRADGVAVTPFDSWLDSRCQPEVERISRELGNEIVDRTGCPPMVDHAPKMAWWRRERPGTYARVAKFLVPSAYVAGRLCDLTAEEAFIDWTHLHFTGVADAVAAEWSPLLADAIGVDICRLPRILAPTAPVGSLSPAGAAACGLRPGTLVAAGLGDTAAGALGAGIVSEGQMLDTAGTASVLSISVGAFRPDPSGTLLLMRGAVPGQWISLSYLPGGDLLSWLPRAFGVRSLGTLVQEAAGTPPARALFVPHLGARLLPASASAQGGWVGLDLSQGRGDLVRAVMESIAYEYAGFLDKAVALFPDLAPREVRVIGGGSRDVLWNKVKASVLGLDYVRLRRESFSCWGAALVAAKSAGLVDDLATAALAANEESERTEPDAELWAVYSKRRADYAELVNLLVPELKEVHA